MARSDPRVNLRLEPHAHSTLLRLSKRLDSDYTETMRKALAVLAYLTDEKDAGRELVTQNADGSEPRTVVFI